MIRLVIYEIFKILLRKKQNIYSGILLFFMVKLGRVELW